MNILYWVFNVTEGVITWENDAKKAQLQGEMATEFDKLRTKYPNIVVWLENPWFRFLLAIFSIPARRYLYDYVNGIQRHEEPDETEDLDEESEFADYLRYKKRFEKVR